MAVLSASVVLSAKLMLRCDSALMSVARRCLHWSRMLAES